MGKLYWTCQRKENHTQNTHNVIVIVISLHNNTIKPLVLRQNTSIWLLQPSKMFIHFFSSAIICSDFPRVWNEIETCMSDILWFRFRYCFWRFFWSFVCLLSFIAFLKRWLAISAKKKIKFITNKNIFFFWKISPGNWRFGVLMAPSYGMNHIISLVSASNTLKEKLCTC